MSNMAKRLDGSGYHLVRTTEVGLGPGDTVLDGDQLPLHAKGDSSPHFSAHCSGPHPCILPVTRIVD